MNLFKETWDFLTLMIFSFISAIKAFLIFILLITAIFFDKFKIIVYFFFKYSFKNLF